jgi:hypothetical protein
MRDELRREVKRRLLRPGRPGSRQSTLLEVPVALDSLFFKQRTTLMLLASHLRRAPQLIRRLVWRNTGLVK